MPFGRVCHIGGWLLLFALLLGHATPPVARGEEALDEAELQKRKRRLKSRAAEWWRTRKPLISICHQCKGRGKVRYGRRRRWVKCPKCDGHKWHLDDDRYKKLFYDMRSPAFRRQDGITEKLEQRFIAERAGTNRPKVIDSYAIEDVEVLDARFGLAYVAVDKDDVARPQKWVWAKNERGKGDWYLWDEAADGRWRVAAPPGEGSGSLPLLAASAEVRAQVLAALRPVDLAFAPRDILVDGQALVLRLLPPPTTRPEVGERRVGPNAVATARAVFTALATYPTLRAEWYGNWRNALGRTEVRVRWSSGLTREKHGLVVWQNLAPDEQVAILDWETHAYDGLIPWPMPDEPSKGPLPSPDVQEGGGVEEPKAPVWVAYQGHTFPPRKTYGHGVAIDESCRSEQDPKAVLCTERFGVAVYQQPEPMRSASEGSAPATAALVFLVAAPETGETLPAWVRVRLFLTHHAKVDVVAHIQDRVDAWAGGVHVGGGEAIGTEKVGGGPHDIVLSASWTPSLEAALDVARAKNLLLQFGGVSGVTLSLGTREISILQDLLSRVVPP